jgi:N-acetylglucosamine kinase-like BadF-type ATPase
MFFLGVDGGNTKTDYLLCTSKGRIVQRLRTGTCSHENFDDGYDGMERAMREQLSKLFKRNNINVKNIAAAGFGLAGADFPHQIEELKKRVEAIGFTRYGLANDGILGIKAASESGAGICAVNGTGTVVVGIDERGEILQIGGVGALSGDAAGGSYIRDKIVSLLYDYHYRCGKDSLMFSRVKELLGEGDLAMQICDYALLHKHMKEIIKIGAQCAVEGDKLAKQIFDDVAVSIAKSVAGCIKRLSFAEKQYEESPIDVIQVGSIWNINYKEINSVFLKNAEKYSGRICRLIKLEHTAAVGGVLWAKEIYNRGIRIEEYRKILLKQ